jgi:spermidine synthase
VTRLGRLEALPGVANVLPDQRHLPDLVGDILAMDNGLDAFLEESARQAGLTRSDLVSTDHSLYLEYATPRGNILPWATREALVRDLLRHRDENAIAGLLVP